MGGVGAALYAVYGEGAAIAVAVGVCHGPSSRGSCRRGWSQR
jgi:hypothetical protein